MKNKAIQYILFLYLVLLIPAGLLSQEGAQTPFDDAIKQFETFVSEHMALDQVPGLSVGIFKDGHVWVQGFGYSDLENMVPARADNSYRLASISKTITALAVLQLVEKGKIDLDKASIRIIFMLRVLNRHRIAKTTVGVRSCADLKVSPS